FFLGSVRSRSFRLSSAFTNVSNLHGFVNPFFQLFFPFLRILAPKEFEVTVPLLEIKEGDEFL
ncbi:MAG: hypothetical protein ACKPEN_12060, partial [Planktothrix sp.]|uniref:hypothetical protein n=1 Tax=Planktothrix sp. TaxID=3088171 RepID=UPI0038D38C96